MVVRENFPERAFDGRARRPRSIASRREAQYMRHVAARRKVGKRTLLKQSKVRRQKNFHGTECKVRRQKNFIEIKEKADNKAHQKNKKTSLRVVQ